MAAAATKNAQVLAFNDLVFFVPKTSQIVDTLFKGPTTASGTFKVRKNGIMFYDLKGCERVFLVANDGSDNFFVSCDSRVSVNKKRQVRYMFGLSSLDSLWLLIRGLSYSEQITLARRLWSEVRPQCC